MDLKSGTYLVPPAVKNSSCSHPRYSGHNFIVHIGIAETIEAVLILILTIGVIGANCLVIFVINNRRYAAYIHQQPRYLLTSLALNDLTIGLLITPFGLLPALFHCWPYGEIFCQIQALLRGALSQQSAVILVCMAVDRYMCALHPRKYYQHSSKKGCVAVLSLTWIINLTIFGFLVLPKGYYFNYTGLMACEPFYSKPSYRILSTCALYFPTTMVLMYCYGSSFHMSRFRLNDPTMPLTAAIHHPHLHHPHHQHVHSHFQQALVHPHQQHQQHQHQHSHQHPHPHAHPHPHQHQYQQQHHQHQHQHHQHALTTATTPIPTSATTTTTNTLPNTPVMNLSMAMGMGLTMPSILGPTNTITKKIVPIHEKNSSSGATSRSMAAISLGFIVMVTPWTIQEVVTACTGSKLPPFLDFVVTWTALSNSLWNPFMYWLLNSDFRRLSRQLMPNKCFPTEETPEHKSQCCHINNDFEITTLPMPPEPPIARPPSASASNSNRREQSGNGNDGGRSGNSDGGTTTSCGLSGGSVLGICARSRANSLSRSASQYVRGQHTHNHHTHLHSGSGGGGSGVGGGVVGGTATAATPNLNYTHVRPDIEGLSEKYWGEILERTMSSGSLHAMQKIIPAHAHHLHTYAHQNPNNCSNTMTTSFTKNSDLNLVIPENDHENEVTPIKTVINPNDLNKFSTSEPKLCEHSFYHDVNCAKNKSLGLTTFTSGIHHFPQHQQQHLQQQMQHREEANQLSGGRSIPDI